MSDSNAPFGFPYPPYNIQVDFMKKLVEVIENGNIGVFESPTGTGKTLSLICGIMTWLKEKRNVWNEGNSRKRKIGQKNKKIKKKKAALFSWGASKAADEDSNDSEEDEEDDEEENQEEPSWVLEQTEKNAQKQETQREDRLNRMGTKRRKLVEKIDTEDPDSDKKKNFLDNLSISAKTLNNLFDSDDEQDENHIKIHKNPDFIKNPANYKQNKIIYCSRTHSQINQFVKEIKKTKFYQDKSIKLVSLGSRTKFCRNEGVKTTVSQQSKQKKKIQNENLLNEKCLESISHDLCPYYSKKDSTAHLANNIFSQQRLKKDTAMNESLFCDFVLSQIRDIEEIFKFAEQHKHCPYYGTKACVAEADIITCPYSVILSPATRKGLGIQSLQNCVIVFDEAHNLIEAIKSSFSASMKLHEIETLEYAISTYLEEKEKKFQFFAAKTEKQIAKYNSFQKLKQIKSILRSLLKVFLEKKQESMKNSKERSKNHQSMCNLNDFLFSLQLDTVNFFDLVEFVENAQLPKKIVKILEKYNEKLKIKPSSSSTFSQASNLVYEFVDFLNCLANFSTDGRIFLNFTFETHENNKSLSTNEKFESVFSFFLLNAANKFQDVISSAKSVILAGGTLQPINLFIKELLSSSVIEENTEKLTTNSEKLKNLSLFQCDHVVNPSNLLCCTMESGIDSEKLKFTFEQRGNLQMLTKFSETLLKIVEIVPFGVIFFFPSYQLETEIFEFWKKNEFLLKFEKHKKLFREARAAASLDEHETSSSSSDADAILKKYKEIIDQSKKKPPNSDFYSGAILNCIVGGKMSEGINFSDDYARCVVVIGCPFPNVKHPMFQEKVKHFKEILKVSPNDLMVNACMKSVNQSIGRAIRHINDYAAIVLMDARYCETNSNNLTKHLPNWIKKSLKNTKNFEDTKKSLIEFFDSKK